ncbi:uncharacterized protein LOC120136469 isoform X3 [Hibiscus syriacus]|nr:uncharacterized protein LOC120136469 isoform X2 [Hibiscus syriacus]XP_039008429.1 uncharacterized protein LOC120136469 isoform X3 [Hibiscus syriacus]
MKAQSNAVSSVGIAWDQLSVKNACTILVNTLAIKVSEPGLRVHSIRNLMEVSDIQPYTCNSSKLVYIKKEERKEHENRVNGGKGEKCDVCGYELQYSTSKFCSIECK